MNARFAHVLSRLSIVAVVAASAVGATACARGPADAEAAPTAEATQAATVEATEATPGHDGATPQAPLTAAAHGPSRWLFKQVEGLDLRDDQRAAVSEIEQNLAADLAPHHETMRRIAHSLADAVERGQLDDATAAAHKATLLAALADVKASFADAVNGIHDTLDAGQRAALVEALRQQQERHAQGAAAGEAPKHGLARLAYELGLDESQRQAIHDAIQQGVDEIFPDRAARREAHEATMKAMAAAFVTDNFDAADYDLADHADEALGALVAITSRAVDVGNRVLSDAQRQAAADLIRAHADKI